MDHIDVFADNVPSLENRVCFSFPAKHRGGRCGRGGFGLEEYTWALLDWGNYRRRRRAVWAHPLNQHLEHSPEWYRNRPQNPRPNQNCTDGVWALFYAANPTFHIPACLNSTREQLDPALPANQRPAANRRNQRRGRRGRRNNNPNPLPAVPEENDVPAIVEEAEDNPDIDDRLVHQQAISDDEDDANDGLGLV